MTEYVVLKRIPLGGDDGTEYGPGSGEAWQWLGVIEATSDVQAIRAMSREDGAHDMSEGAIAVPARSWRPRKPERKVRETTLWS